MSRYRTTENGNSESPWKDLFSSKYIAKELLRLTSLPPSKISTEDFRWLQLYKDTQLFVNPTPEYFIYVKEKGGRERLAPVIGIKCQSDRRTH